MKKLFTILFAGLLTFGLSAQTDAGSVMLGVSSDATLFSSMTPDATTEFGLDVDGGYFVMDNLAVMAKFGFGSTKTGDADAVGTTKFGAGASYYISGNIPVGLMWESEKIGDADATSTLSIKAGYLIMLNEKVGIQPGFTYKMESVGGEATQSGFVLGGGLSVFL